MVSGRKQLYQQVRGGHLFTMVCCQGGLLLSHLAGHWFVSAPEHAHILTYLQREGAAFWSTGSEAWLCESGDSVLSAG